MELRLHSQGLKRKRGREGGLSPFLEEFIRTTVAFSVWHQRPPVERIDIHVDGEAGHFRCTLVACASGRRSVGAGATGEDLYDAVQAAASLLEVALRRPARPVPDSRTPARLPARRRAAGPYSGLAPTPVRIGPVPAASARS